MRQYHETQRDLLKILSPEMDNSHQISLERFLVTTNKGQNVYIFLVFVKVKIRVRNI